MEKDYKQDYLDIVVKNKKKTVIFRRIILAAILVSIVLVVIQPALIALLLIGIFALVLFFGVIYAISAIAESEAEEAYKTSIGENTDDGNGLDVEKVVEDYIKGLKSID